jgi:hypothetical protein
MAGQPAGPGKLLLGMKQDFDAIALAQKVKAKAPESRARPSLARLLDKGAAATSAFDARNDLRRVHRRL